MSTVNHIGQLKSDPQNARKHNPRNIGMIEDSLQTVGAARSIVIDEENTILSGNGTVEAAGNVGITKVHEVEVDGLTIVAVKRIGLTPEQKIRLALADNRAAELASWDNEALAQLHAEAPEAFNGMWSLDEMKNLFKADPAKEATGDEEEMLDPVGDADVSKNTLQYIHYKNWDIPLVDGEDEDLSQLVTDWIAQSGTLYGFFANLITRVRS